MKSKANNIPDINSPIDAGLQAQLDAIVKKIRANPNADGWVRLCEILKKAKHDKRIIASGGASEFLELVYELASDSLTAANARPSLMPLTKALKSEEQSNNRKGKKNKLTESGDTLDAIIARLADREDETAAELWPALYGELDALQLKPKEREDKNYPRKSYFDYGVDKHITFGQFANRISAIRTKSG